VGGDLALRAQDRSGVYANSKLVSTTSTSNDGGLGLLNKSIEAALSVDHLSAETSATLLFGQRVRLANDFDASLGVPGGVYEYMGQTAAGVDLSAEDYTDFGLWKRVTETQLIPLGNNISDSSAVTIGGLVVRNDVRSEVESFINHAVVGAASVTVEAVDRAVILATADSTASASGGSLYGTGTVVAVNGVIATNLVLSKANAFIASTKTSSLRTHMLPMICARGTAKG
jgi:hypothetical protein